MMLNWKIGSFSLECEKCAHTNKLPLAQTIRLIDHHHRMELYRKKERIIKTLEWMVADMKWREDHMQEPPYEYSSEVQEAIDLLAELKDEK